MKIDLFNRMFYIVNYFIMDTFISRSNTKYFFVCQDSNDDTKYRVCSEFIINRENTNIISGQYISSLYYQSMYSFDNELVFYIVEYDNVPNARMKLQDMFDTNINDLHEQCSSVYMFLMYPNHMIKIYETCKKKFLNKKENKSRVREIIESRTTSSGKKCNLELNMIVTSECIHKTNVILNMPRFTITK